MSEYDIIVNELFLGGDGLSNRMENTENLSESTETPGYVRMDTERLEWIAENSIAIRKGGELSADPYYFVIFRKGTTSRADNDFRKAIDCAMDETVGAVST